MNEDGERIPLTCDMFTVVDQRDYEKLSAYKWFAQSSRGGYYAVRNRPTTNGERGAIRMHREILGLERGDGIQVDHLDGDGLNNRRSNLRICTHSQNCFNRKALKKSSRFKGVCFYCVKTRPNWRRWRAQIRINGKSKHVGYFKDEVHAAVAYDEKAKELFGEFAKLNFPDGVMYE